MFEFFTQINSCLGVSLRVSPRATKIAALVVSRHGKRLELGKRFKDKINIEQVLKEADPGLAVSLNISGKAVIVKALSNAGTAEELFSRLMPGSDENDFYQQCFVTGDRLYLAVIRKSEADPYIRQFNDQGYRVVQLSLGPFPVEQVKGQLNQYDGGLQFDGHTIETNEQGEWQDYRFAEDAQSRFPLKLGVEAIDEQLLLPYAAAFQAILYERIDPIEANAPASKEGMDQFRLGGRVKKKAALALGAAFILLFANTFLFLHLNSENSRLQEALSRNSIQASDISAVAGRNARTEALITDIGYRKAPPLAVFLDQAAALMPADIDLLAADFNPVTTKRAENKGGSLFTDHRLTLTGSCPSILPVNEWLARLRSLHWVSRAELQDYGLGDTDEKGKFTIIITY